MSTANWSELNARMGVVTFTSLFYHSWFKMLFPISSFEWEQGAPRAFRRKPGKDAQDRQAYKGEEVQDDRTQGQPH